MAADMPAEHAHKSPNLLSRDNVRDKTAIEEKSK
jgi:hypothetical protein